MSQTLLLADENNLFRQGLCALLAAHDEFRVVDDVRSGREAVQSTLTHLPEIVMTDLVLSGLNGFEVTSQIKSRRPQVKVVILTSLQTEEAVRSALHAGADGYVLKDASFEELVTALRCVARGKNYLSPDVSGHVLQRFLNPDSSKVRTSPLETLTIRERSILQLVAGGGTNRMAAEMLNVSPKTIEKDRAKLMHKLGLKNLGELVLMALELGLIERPNGPPSVPPQSWTERAAP
jgi:DNA-binding NarL/FixJ family response regulator